MASIGAPYLFNRGTEGVYPLKHWPTDNLARLTMRIKAEAQKVVPAIFNKVGRPLFQHFWRWSRGLTLGVRAIVTDQQGHILLIRQTYTAGWTLPGGGVERGETLVRSLERELDEEAGVAIEGTPELMGIYDNQAAFPGDHIAIYIVRNWSRIRVPQANLEIAETGFFDPIALPDSLAPGARRRIEEMLGERPPELLW